MNRRSTITDAASGVTTFGYNLAGQLTSLRDPENNDTTYARDLLGRVTQEENELGHSRYFVYDAASNLTLKKDRNARLTAYSFDDLDRLTSENWLSGTTSLPSLAVATTTQGGPINEVQRVGMTVSMAFTSGTFTLSFGGQTTSGIAYNASAATVETALAALSSIGSGNILVTKSQNTTTAQEWTLTFQGSLAGANQSQVTINSSGVMGFMTVSNIQATDTNGNSGVNEVQTVTLSNATAGTFRLAFGNESTGPIAYNASSGTVQTALTGLSTIGSGNVSVSGSAGGPYTATFQGALAGINVAALQGDASHATSGSIGRTISFTWDDASQLTAASDPAASYSTSFDDIGRVSSETQSITGLTPSIVMAQVWDAASNRSSLAVSIGGTADYKNDYTYDNLDQLTRVVQQGQSGGNTLATKRVDFAYNAVGQFTTIDRFQNTGGTNGVAQTTFTYDTLNRLATLDHKQSTTTLAGYSFGYDFANRTTSLTSSVEGTASYTFDVLSQVTAATYSGQSNESYSFDAAGNRNSTGYTVGAGNLITSDGTYNYTYDNEGNRTRRTKISDGSYTDYEWDYRNRLTKVTEKTSGGTVTKVTEYAYDLFNRLVKRSHDPDGAGASAAVDTYYTGYDGIQPTLVFDGASASNLSHRYLFGVTADQILADENVTSLSTAGNILWALPDQLGSVRDIADQDESTHVTTVTNHRTYNSFGLLVAETNSGVQIAFGYTGKLLDRATGLQYNWNRWYDAALGQWLSQDPLDFGGGDYNLRRYVLNGSVLFIDPTGLAPKVYKETWFDKAVAVFGGTAGDGADRVIKGTDQFASGMASSLTGGLTDHAREVMYGEIATQNHEGGLRTAGELTGTAMSVAIGAGNPCAIGGMTGAAMKGLSAADAAGSAISAAKDVAKGDYGSAVLNAAGVAPGLKGAMGACFIAGTQVAVRPDETFVEAGEQTVDWNNVALWTGVGAAGVAAIAAATVLERRRRQQTERNADRSPTDEIFANQQQYWLGDLFDPLAEWCRENLAELPERELQLRGA